MDVDVLAGRDERRRSPACRGEILGDRGGEVAGVREEGDRALDQRFVGRVAAERASEAHAAPRIGDAERVGAEDVDAEGLPDGPDLARVMDGDLFRDDDDLFEVRVDAGELGYAVAHAGGRQIDDTGVETVAGIDAFADAVVDRNVAGGCGEDLAAAARRGSEDDVPTGEGVADRRDLAGFAAEDVEDRDAVGARGDIAERGDPEIVRKADDSLLRHFPLPVPSSFRRLP